MVYETTNRGNSDDLESPSRSFPILQVFQVWFLYSIVLVQQLTKFQVTYIARCAVPVQ